MRNTGGSSRSKSNKDKGSSKSIQSTTQNTVKSEGPPLKVMQPTAEQLALNNLIHSTGKDVTEDAEQQKKIKQIMDITGCSQEKAEIALYDNKNDLDRAVNHVLEGADDEDEWRESGKKKKKQKQEPTPAPIENNIESKPERQRDNREKNDRDNRDRNKEENGDRSYREPSDNYRQRQRRNDNRPPRLSRGRGRPDKAGDRPDREDEEKDDNRERGFDRGRGRGRGFGGGPRRGRGGGNFRSRGGFDKGSQFDNGPQIDTWTNETAVIGEKEPKISNWTDPKEDWNEDIDSWSGSLAETKVFTSSTTPVSETQSNQVQIESANTLSNTFDIGVLYPKHPQNDSMAEASYISQFNQQATESIKNSIGIGSGPSSSLQNSMNSQTASNVSALVSLQQNALHDNLGPSLNVSELTGSSLTGSGLSGNSLVGTSLGNSLSTSLPVNSLTGSTLHSTSLSGNSLSGNTLTSLSGSSLSGGNNLTGTNVTGSGLTGTMSGSTAQSAGGISSSSVSQNAMLQQRKPQRSKLPPPSKIPASAVEMPGNVMTTLDVQFGTLELSFGGNESVTNAFSNAETISTSTMDGAGQVPGLNKPSDTLISATLDQSSSRSTAVYQQSPYTTPTKQTNPDSTNNMNTAADPLQMSGSGADLKSNSLISGQNPQVSLPTSKMDSNLGSYSSGSSYQSTGYQSQKPSGFNNQSSRTGSYTGSQYQSTPSQNQSSSNQYSSQFRQSNQNQYQSSGSQFPSGSQYQSPPSGYQSSQTGYPSQQSGFQSNQSQYQSGGQGQYQNFQSSSTFQNQSNYSSNQSSQSALYQSTTTASYSNQSQQSSLYSQNSRPGSYSNQSYLNEHPSGAGSSFQTSVSQSNTGFKENQSGASSFRENVASSGKTRDSQNDSSFNRDTQSASSFSDSQSMAYNRDSQSVGSSYGRDPTSSYKRDSKSASGSFPRDTPPSDNSVYNRDSQSASASYNVRDSQTTSTGFRDTQSGASGYGGQAGSYPRESGQSQSQTGYSAKNYRNSAEVTSLQSSLTGSKLVDNFSKMAVKDGALDNIQSTNSQYDSVSSSAKITTNSTTLSSSSTSSNNVSSTGTTVINSTTTKISTLPSASSASSKAPNLPPGVPLMAAQQYIMGQAGTLPFYNLQGLQSLQQPLYANVEDFQYVRQGMPPLATSNMYDMSGNAAAAGLPIPPTTINSNSTQQTIPTVPYSASNDTNKLPRVDAQSPTGSVGSNSQPAGSGQSATHQPPYIHLNYGYYYPPSLIPGAGFQYPMIPMPQVTNAAHATPANTQYQQKNYGSHLQYGTNKMYDDITAQTGGDFSKSPYGTSQNQPKPNINSTVTVGSGSSQDIQIPGYAGKTHAQAFDKQGFHAGTPPPFNLQIAAGQLATGSQAGPLGAPTAAFGGQFVPMMTHQPHSQMMHHPLQDTTSSNRGSQPSGGHTQSKSSSKTYNTSNWGSY